MEQRGTKLYAPPLKNTRLPLAVCGRTRAMLPLNYIVLSCRYSRYERGKTRCHECIETHNKFYQHCSTEREGFFELGARPM